MLSCQSVPRIRVDLSNGSPYSLSPSSTLDITHVLGQAKLLPMLLAEDFVFDDADNALYFEDGRLQDFPSFPMARQPLLFILSSHRGRLPFHLRPDAFELGDFYEDEEGVCPLLTAPTAPRMKVIMKEQLYVQKWVDSLTLDSPPKHIPWTCEKPAKKQEWIAEGSIFPADVIKRMKSSTGQRGAIQEHSGVTDTDRFSVPIDQASNSLKFRSPLEVSAPVHASTEFHTSMLRVRTKSADVDPGILRGESKTSHTPHRLVRISQPLSLCTSDAPLATRRGKSLSSLKSKGCVIEHMEYPDIPTAFRGSPIIWSPRFDTFPVPSFTDHESMLLDLKSKCTALGSGVPPLIQEPPRPQTQLTRTSLSVDEWSFTRGLATFDNSFLGSINGQVPRDMTTDTSIFLPDDSSTPVKGPGFTARLEFVPRLYLTPASQSPGNRSSDPPGVPLPLRPALINPSTPPHVRGILKKVKNVRFEDVTTKGSENQASPVVPPPQGLSERSFPSPVAAPSERPCTPMPKTAESSNGRASVKEAFGKNIQKRSTPSSGLPPRRAKTNAKLRPTHLDVGNAPEHSKPTLITTSAQRPCRIVHAQDNANSAVPRAQTKQKGMSITEVDVRRGIEGTTKGRLSTPLRNIFRFK